MRHASRVGLWEVIILVAAIGLLCLVLSPILAGGRGSAPGVTGPLLERVGAASRMYGSDEELQAQCLTHVQKISRAVQMYLSDYGRLPPAEHRPQVVDYFQQRYPQMVECRMATDANPYLRWPVILDAYLKDRQVWACPGAHLGRTAGWIVPGPDWFGYERKHAEAWGSTHGKGEQPKGAVGGPCQLAWPPGWGGTVTDSIAQRKLGSASGQEATGAFQQHIGCTEATGLAKAAVADPAWFVVCGDSNGENLWSPLILAYPEVCHLAMRATPEACAADWEACTWSRSCGLPESEYREFQTDPAMRPRYTRHLGGSNVGFMDGHASWMSADDIILDSPDSDHRDKGILRGIGCICLGWPAADEEE